MPKGRWVDEEYVVCVYTMEYYLAIQKMKTAICNDINGTRGGYVKWNKSKGKQVISSVTIERQNKETDGIDKPLTVECEIYE